MTRIAPVNLAYNPKTLWFDARDLEIGPRDFVVVLTARGVELGHMAGPVFEATPEDLTRLKSELRGVKRVATEEDIAQGERMEELGKEALPIFREMVEETGENMRPISVEYLLEGDKAVFYFEAEDRVDFRDLVRALAARFHVRVDMRQIGVRDEARMVGGYGHCGQQLCCCRMGGEFCPVSIRMAKEQDLSLNPQKISGVCGRLMCCLRYEYEAYKDFKSRAPKQNAVIDTPEGPAKVSAMDVPREVITLRLEEDHKTVKVPLSAMETPEGAQRPNSVGQEAWDEALNPEPSEALVANFMTSQLTGSDQLGQAKAVRRNNANVKNATGSTPLGEPKRDEGSRRSRRRRKAQEEVAPEPVVTETVHRQRRRRSTKLGADGTQTQVSVEVEETAVPGGQEQAKPERRERVRRERASRAERGERAEKSESGEKAAKAERPERAERTQDEAAAAPEERTSRRRRRRGGSKDNAAAEGQNQDQNQGEDRAERQERPGRGRRGDRAERQERNQGGDAKPEQKDRPRPGRRSSGLRQAHNKGTDAAGANPERVERGERTDGGASRAERAGNPEAGEGNSSRRRRRRSRKPQSSEGGAPDAS